MARLVIDLGDNPVASDEPVPEGKYSTEITNCQQVEVKSGENKGLPMYLVTCKILDGEQKGRVASRRVMLYPGKEGKALIGYYQLAKAVGQPVAVGTKKLEILEENEIIGKKVDIIIVHRPYDDPQTGETRTVYDIQRFVPPTGGAGDAVASTRGKRVSL